MLLRTARAVLVVCAILLSNASAEVLHGEISFEHFFDLETGDSVFCSGARCGTLTSRFDFYFLSSTGVLVLRYHSWNPANVRRIAILEEQPFDTVGFSDIGTVSFTTEALDIPLENNDTVILQSELGAYYKIGYVVSDGILLVNFDYEELTDAGHVFSDGFENPQ